MVTPRHLRGRAAALAQYLGRLGKQAWVGSAYVTRNLLPGAFRSPYRLPTGVELDLPRIFTCDDDPSCISTSHIPPSLVVHSLGEAILREDMRVVQAMHLGEAKFLVLIDLSLSMLTGCFEGEDVEQLHVPARAKFQKLYFAVSAYLRIAEAAGFAPAAVMLYRRSPESQRPAGPRYFTQQVLFGMTDRLADAFDRADADPALREPFLLADGFNLALAIRNRSVMVVVSDFLDPLEKYEPMLVQACARHQVVLVDVASTWDRAFPVPGWLEMAVARTRRREGARHLEEGTQEECLDRDAIADWNSARQADRLRLEKLARRLSYRVVTFDDLSYAECTTRALQSLSGIR